MASKFDTTTTTTTTTKDMNLGRFGNYHNTVQLKRKFKKGTKSYRSYKQFKKTFKQDPLGAVAKPDDCSRPDWIKINTVKFYNELVEIYSLICQHCTADTCPTMTAGPKYEFLWAEGEYKANPTALSARDYMDNLFAWAHEILHDESVFPSDDSPTPPDFTVTCDKLFRRLIRVFYHVFYHHFDEDDSKMALHLKQGFLHFCLFTLNLELIHDRSQYEPLYPLCQLLLPPDYLAKLDALPKIASNSNSNNNNNNATATATATATAHRPRASSVMTSRKQQPQQQQQK